MRSLTGAVYMLHFSTPYKHAAHYLGLPYVRGNSELIVAAEGASS